MLIMKRNVLFLFSVILVSLFSCKNNMHDGLLDFGPYPLPVPEQNSLMAKWEKKALLDTRLLDDMESDSGWTVSGIGEMSYTKDRARDGSQSLRFRTSLRDEEHYKKNRSEWDSFIGTQGGFSSVAKQFATAQNWTDFNRISFWVYVHPSSTLTYCLYLNIENKGTVYNSTTPGKSHFIQDLKPGEWNHVMFEIPHLRRDSVTSIRINQMLIGHNPEEGGIVTYDLDQVELERVDADQYEGWTVSPGKIAFSHIGYRPGDPKIALAGNGADNKFQLIDRKEHVVFTGEIIEIENSNGIFKKMDFTGFREPGIYQLRSGSLLSGTFPIDENIWLQPVFKAMNFFFCERCGYFVPGIHRECHKDWQGFHGDDKKIINGGWHDAGDLSQGSWRTSMAVYSMMANLEALGEREDAKPLADRIRSEIEWGLEWLLKTRFGDGYHMSFSVMRIYTDNKVGTIDDVVTPAKNVPWENFLTAAVQAKAAMVLEKTNPELATRSRVAAIEDFHAALDSRTEWDLADYREASWGITSSILLGEMTGDEKYKEHAIKFGNLLIRCQEQSFVDSIPITGYFYENTDRNKVIHNFHAAFEEAPLIALTMLCRSFPENENWISWYSAAVLHSEFFMKRGSQIASPYYLLPNSVWKESEIIDVKEPAVREDMQRQFNDGTPLNKEYVLRTFPIYHDGLFHGNTNIHMSSSWALAEASSLRKDTSGMKLVGNQLQWIFGANPFSQSLMYGEGYDFAPHFAYCLKDIVGSLPVGMDCMSGDMPHWAATNTATSKEIWVEPVNRFLGAVSVYNTFSKSTAKTDKQKETVIINSETQQSDSGVISVKITCKGSGKHDLTIRTYNAESTLKKQQIDLSGGETVNLEIELNVTDRSKPYVAVISIDNDPDLNKEIVGSFINSPF
jgi:hypothetical protein